MEHPSEFDNVPLTNSEVVCPCGRTFLQASMLTNHQCTCSKCKKHLSSVLEKAKSLWNGKWRCLLSTVTGANSEDSVAAVKSPVPGLVPTPVPAEETVEIFVEVCITYATDWKRMLTVCPVAHGHRRFAPHNDGMATMDFVNQLQAAEEISRQAPPASPTSFTGSAWGCFFLPFRDQSSCRIKISDTVGLYICKERLQSVSVISISHSPYIRTR